jgi:hypothetical protein
VLQQARRLVAEILVTRSITGVTWRHLLIEDFERLVGKGIFYGAARSEGPTPTVSTSTSSARETRRDRARSARLRAHGRGRPRERAVGARPGPVPARDERPGLFACGDVRSSPIKRVAAAVGDGSMAVAFVHQYPRDPA